MYQLQDTKLPGDDLTIKQKFETFYCDDVELVYCHTNEKIYKYSYNVMCQDITDDRSWTKLPTNLILLVLSWIFNLEIIIVNELNDHELILNSYENIEDKNSIPELKKIYLSHIGGESHYVPLDILEQDKTLEILLHNDIKPLFYEWGIEMAKCKYNIDSNEDNSESNNNESDNNDDN